MYPMDGWENYLATACVANFLSERFMVIVSTIGSRRNSFFNDSRTCRAAIAL